MNELLAAIVAAVVGVFFLVWAVHVVITVLGWILIIGGVLLAIKWIVTALSNRSSNRSRV